MSFHQRLQQKINEKGIKPAELARAASVSNVAAGKWIHGDSIPKAEKLKLIAGFLQVSDTWLLTGKGSDSEWDANVDISNKISIEGRAIPVISWVQAGSWTGIDSVAADTEFDEWLPPNVDCGKNGYALIVVGNSMKPDFKPGDRIYVNPDIQTFDLQTDDLVIVACNGDTEATFKKLIIEGGERYLQPLNPNWPEQIIKLSEDCRLVGKVVGLYRKI